MLPMQCWSIIMSLEPGEEIIVRAGGGDPPADEDRVTIFHRGDGGAGITADGAILRSCQGDGGYVERTGNSFEPETYEVSERTTRILAEIAAATPTAA